MKINSINTFHPKYLSNKSKINSSVSFKGDSVKLQEMGTDAILECSRMLVSLLEKGKYNIAEDAAGLLKAGKIREAIDFISKNAPVPGSLKQTDKGIELMTFDWDNSAKVHLFEKIKGFKNLGIVEEIDDKTKEKLFRDAFGVDPKVKLGAVGWSSIKPENVKGGTSLTKAQLQQKYEEAIDEFLTPILEYVKKGLGISPKETALVSSASYSGVDKAVMDLGQNKDIPTLTITPYAYGIYAKNKHPFPTVFTPEINQYAKGYSRLADEIVVTGGRDHAFKLDVGEKWLEQNGIAIPVDVLKDYENIEVPSKINGKIENAAALAFETFENPFAKGLSAEFKNLPYDSTKSDLQHDAQKALASAIYRNIKS